jgi:hypothetical protein
MKQLKPIMNYRRILSTILALGIVLLSACGDDETSFRERFSFEDQTLAVKDAKVYLTYEGTFDGRPERDYLITDGVYNSESGLYGDATYFIEVYLVEEEEEEEFRTGNYPAWDDWNDAASTSRISYIEAYAAMDDDNYFRLETLSDAEGEDNVKVSGGFDDGETITFKYSGDVNYYHLNDDDDWVNETVSGNFTVKGEIEDITSSPVARQKGRKLLN